VTIPEKRLNIFCNSKLNRQVCVTLAGAKNLAEVSREQKRAAGATKKKTEVKEKLFEYAWWMKKTGILRRDHKM